MWPTNGFPPLVVSIQHAALFKSPSPHLACTNPYFPYLRISFSASVFRKVFGTGIRPSKVVIVSAPIIPKAEEQTTRNHRSCHHNNVWEATSVGFIASTTQM